MYLLNCNKIFITHYLYVLYYNIGIFKMTKHDIFFFFLTTLHLKEKSNLENLTATIIIITFVNTSKRIKVK